MVNHRAMGGQDKGKIGKLLEMMDEEHSGQECCSSGRWAQLYGSNVTGD